MRDRHDASEEEATDRVAGPEPASSPDGSRTKTHPPVTFSRLTAGVSVTPAEVDALWKLYVAFVDKLSPKDG